MRGNPYAAPPQDPPETQRTSPMPRNAGEDPPPKLTRRTHIRRPNSKTVAPDATECGRRSPPQIEAPDKCTGTEFQKTIAPQTGYPNLPSPTPLPTPAPTTTDLTTLRRTTANKGPLTPSTQLPRPTSHIRALKRHVTTRPMARTKSTTTRRRQRAPQMSPTPPPLLQPCPTLSLPNHFEATATRMRRIASWTMTRLP